MSNSVRPHRRQPTRLPRPWDSPGENSGVGCHFLLQCMKVKSESEVAQSCPTLCNPMDCSPPGSSVHGIFQARVLPSFNYNMQILHLSFHQISLFYTVWNVSKMCSHLSLLNMSSSLRLVNKCVFLMKSWHEADRLQRTGQQCL